MARKTVKEWEEIIVGWTKDRNAWREKALRLETKIVHMNDDAADVMQERDDAAEEVCKLKREAREYLESAQAVRDRGLELHRENVKMRERFQIINDITAAI